MSLTLNRILALVFATATLNCMSARANLLLNGSFEDSVVDAGDVCGPYAYCRAFTPGDTIDGWMVIGKGGVAGTAMVISRNYVEPDSGDGQTLHFDPADGNQSIDLTGEGNQGTTNGIKQTVATIPGQIYQLTFDVGHQYDQAPGYPGPASVSLWLDLTGGGSSEVGVYANGADTPDDVTWETFSYDFEAVSDSTTIAFLNATDVGNNFAGLDAVSLVALLPEAPSGWMLGVGILMLWPMLAGRRRAA
ncbi:MAG TPA: DUF642 domain-containing protein [Alphaproteobacteria bacterium]|nr:DUF642 domain-containing protein [Alphaproteobacteria bacterium]